MLFVGSGSLLSDHCFFIITFQKIPKRLGTFVQRPDLRNPIASKCDSLAPGPARANFPPIWQIYNLSMDLLQVYITGPQQR